MLRKGMAIKEVEAGYINEHLGVESRVYGENLLVGTTIDLIM